MRLFRWVAAFAVVSPLLVAPVPAQALVRVRPEVVRAVEATGESEVFVLFAARAAPEHDLSARRRAVADAGAAVTGSLSPGDVRVQRRFTYISGFTATVTAAGLRQLVAHPNVIAIEPPQYGSGALAQSVPQIRADAVHRRNDGGQGVTVAVLDTGIDPTHPDLAGSVVDEHCICGTDCCPDGTSEQSGAGSAYTTAVHGIHVSGIIVSKGLVAPRGVAPDAKILAVKVLADSNRGQVSDWLAALDWIAANRPDVQAINMSLESDFRYRGFCDTADATTTAFAQVISALRARGTLTFAASGNYMLYSQMAAPACVSAAVAVGAVTKHDTVAFYSNADSALDILAPGGCNSASGLCLSQPGALYPEEIISTGTGHSTAALSGTSMATPHVTGTAALLLSFDPTLDADTLEGILKNTGVPIRDPRNHLIFPRLNAFAALKVVLNTTRPLSGGGPGASDCLVEWNVDPPDIATPLPYPRLVCHDGDPRCDHDQTPGQCTFFLSACFNVPDHRLPSCSTDAPIVSYNLVASTQGGSAADIANAAAIRAALPPLPVAAQNTCTASIPVVVPVAQSPGVKWVRFLARAADGRIDYDRVRLLCMPAAP